MGKIITLKKGLSILNVAIQKAKGILDGSSAKQPFSAEEYMKYYDCVYSLCCRGPPDFSDYSEQLVLRYKTAMEDGIRTIVLPSLNGKTGNFLLTELLRMWTNYEAMGKRLRVFFQHLERLRGCKKAEPLYALSIRCFCDLVCSDFYEAILDAALSLITAERDGQQIDRGLLQRISTFFEEVGGQEETFYHDQFENAVLADTAKYYSQLASEWLLSSTFGEYIQKVGKYLEQEKEGKSFYLSKITVAELLKVANSELIDKVADKVARLIPERGRVGLVKIEVVKQ